MPRTPEKRQPSPAEIALRKGYEDIQTLFDEALLKIQGQEPDDIRTSVGKEITRLWAGIAKDLFVVGKRYPIRGELSGCGYKGKDFFAIYERCLGLEGKSDISDVRIALKTPTGSAWLRAQKDSLPVYDLPPSVAVPRTKFKVFCQNERREIRITIGKSGLVEEIKGLTIRREQGLISGVDTTELSFQP